MAETPLQPGFQNVEGTAAASGSRLVPRWKTPMRKALGTPRSHRLFASAGPRTATNGTSKSHSYEGLVNKTWRPHTLSPLFNFKKSKVSLKQYGRSLDLAFSKGTLNQEAGMEHESKSYFEVYHGLSFHADDPDAIRIQVTEIQDTTEKVVLTAFLCCVDLENPGIVDSSVCDAFVFYPLVLVCGNKTRKDILLDWLQRHFDCRSSPMEFTDTDLRWFFALGCQLGEVSPEKSHPVSLQYNLGEACQGINNIDCKFESSFCKELWDKQQKNSTNDEFLTETQVLKFIDSLEDHLEYTMHIIFSKLNLSQVETPTCCVARDGKLKILDSRGIYVVLHMMCEIIALKYTQGFG